MLTEENALECSLSAVHITFCTKLLALLCDDTEEMQYNYFLNETLGNGKRRDEIFAEGFPGFQDSHGWFTCNS